MTQEPSSPPTPPVTGSQADTTGGRSLAAVVGTRIALGVGITAMIFSLAVTVLLLGTYVQLRRTRPLNHPALEKLRAEYARTGKRQLALAIREMDFLARKAYFTGRQQVRLGCWLLLAGVLVTLACARVLLALNPRSPAPPLPPSGNRPWLEQRRACNLLAGLAVVLVTGALLLGTLTRQQFEPCGSFAASGRGATAPTRQDNQGSGARQAPPPASPARMARNWPCFRGPDGLGRVRKRRPPLTWDAKSGENILWRATVKKPGFSSPAVWEGRVFITAADRAARMLYALDAGSGALLWQRTICGIRGSPSQPPAVSPDTGYAAPTPATDGRRVFALFANGDLAAYTLTGNNIWSLNLGVPDNHYGHSSSLLVHRDLLLVQYDDSKRCRLLAIDTASGHIRWEVRRQGAISWASPILVPQGKSSLVVLIDSLTVSAHDADTGKLAWRTPCMEGEVAPSPAYAGGRVFVAQDGVFTAALDARDGHILWKNEEVMSPEVASPVATRDHVFILSGSGDIQALDAATGKLLWRRSVEDGFYASPLVIGNKVLAVDRKGRALWFEASNRYRELARASLGEAVVTTPAIVGGRIYIRSAKHVFCIGTE